MKTYIAPMLTEHGSVMTKTESAVTINEVEFPGASLRKP